MNYYTCLVIDSDTDKILARFLYNFSIEAMKIDPMTNKDYHELYFKECVQDNISLIYYKKILAGKKFKLDYRIEPYKTISKLNYSDEPIKYRFIEAPSNHASNPEAKDAVGSYGDEFAFW